MSELLTSSSSPKVSVKVKGSRGRTFAAYRTSDDEDRNVDVGTFTLAGQSQLTYTAPARSATTFVAR